MLPSLQKPKKVAIIGSNGREYPFLCKPKASIARAPARPRARDAGCGRGVARNLAARRAPAQDDLRKDCRMMEFNAMISRLLKKDTASRRRQLHVRTYAVVPLNEECGLIEWMQGTIGLRHVLLHIYKQRSTYTAARRVMKDAATTLKRRSLSLQDK